MWADRQSEAALYAGQVVAAFVDRVQDYLELAG